MTHNVSTADEVHLSPHSDVPIGGSVGRNLIYSADKSGGSYIHNWTRFRIDVAITNKYYGGFILLAYLAFSGTDHMTVGGRTLMKEKNMEE
jgi:hypothetical protein